MRDVSGLEQEMQSLYTIAQVARRWNCEYGQARLFMHANGVRYTRPAGGHSQKFVSVAELARIEAKMPQTAGMPVLPDSGSRLLGSSSARDKGIFLDRILFPKKEAAYLLGLSVRKVEYLVSSGELKSRVVHGRRLFPIDDLKKFARADHPRVGGRSPRPR